MYNKFFGFKEKPFKLVPNPEYLFLSKSHEEALAHLSYAITQGDGFVEITGEVGTGKTTLCRVFLENLDKSIEAAYIFNPKLDALQLLKAINDEFGIDSAPDNTKDLIDRLNAFLIEKKAAGQKALVVIDEAQNLSLEVLEQLRLLSNLETTREKLLQIILVGQPELGDMLSSHQLRQLGQRITINCQLAPLTFQETKDYIRHRIALASHRAGPPFDNAAYRAIFEYSRGIPRLINIGCDRALLNGFSRNSFIITGTIAKEAIAELSHKSKKTPGKKPLPASLVMLTALVAVLAAVLLYLNYGSSSSDSRGSQSASLAEDAKAQKAVLPSIPEVTVAAVEPHSQPEAQENQLAPESAAPAAAYGANKPAESSESAAADLLPAAESMAESSVGDGPADSEAAAEEFLQFLKSLNARHSRNSAMLEILKLWHQTSPLRMQTMLTDSDPVFFREAAEEKGLSVQPVATTADLDLIQTLDLPVILTFYLPNHAWPKYLAIGNLDAEKAYLHAGDQGGIIGVDRGVLLRFWSGEAFIVWKNFSGLDDTINEHSGAEAVKGLQMLLLELSYTDTVSSGKYDEKTQELVKGIQTKNGLNADGIVGPLTKIVLYNENPGFSKPSLVKITAASRENGS